MSLSLRRRVADDAALNLARQRTQFLSRTGGMLCFAERWRSIILVGSGLAGGYLLGQHRTARLASNAASIASLGIALMRSTFAQRILLSMLEKQAGQNGKEPNSADPGNRSQSAR